MPWFTVFVEKLIVVQMVKKFPTFYEVSMLSSQKLATGPNPHPDESNLHLRTLFYNTILILSFLLLLDLSIRLFPSDYPIKDMYDFLMSPMHATYRAHPFTNLTKHGKEKLSVMDLNQHRSVFSMIFVLSYEKYEFMLSQMYHFSQNTRQRTLSMVTFTFILAQYSIHKLLTVLCFQSGSYRQKKKILASGWLQNSRGLLLY
jgi:hypothetical protein